MYGALAPTPEQVQGPTQNNQLSTIEEKEHTQRLTHVEWDVDTARATVEKIEATLVHLASTGHELSSPGTARGPTRAIN